MANEITIPTITDLVNETESTVKMNNLMVLLNQNPPNEWLVSHPMINGYRYIPIERVEWLLSRIFKKWWVEILDSKIVANSAVVTVRLFVINPLDGTEWHNDGIGCAPIQTDKGAGATDFNKVKSDGVTKAMPSAETYAIKDAADKFGKIFGKDSGRKTNINYNNLIKESITKKDLV
ncbi:hypothetical protein ACJRPK_14110 [Aquimarina sp. 2-A2]|uniref:hypothetical protein n=1 Tax=Aquimarina sp. 2-A2 TaxID=3382644 RepID=UPI00387F0F51